MPGSHFKVALISAALSGVSSKLPLCSPILFHSRINVDVKVVLLDDLFASLFCNTSFFQEGHWTSGVDSLGRQDSLQELKKKK